MTLTNQVPQQCPKCGSSIKLVPAGVSKRTGKPYNAFYACSNRDCDYIFRQSSKQDKIVEALKQILKNQVAISQKIDKLAGSFEAFTLIFTKQDDPQGTSQDDTSEISWK